MDTRYNFYNIEASFKKFLLAGNKTITVKNYLSDLRHFFGWIVLELKINDNLLKTEDLSINIPTFLNVKSINQYKSYLVNNNIPLQTVNRRLSTIRKFCSFCISQGWMKNNPGKQVQNSKLKTDNHNSEFKEKNLINEFEKDLISQKIDQSTINNYLNNIQEYLAT